MYVIYDTVERKGIFFQKAIFSLYRSCLTAIYLRKGNYIDVIAKRVGKSANKGISVSIATNQRVHACNVFPICRSTTSIHG